MSDHNKNFNSNQLNGYYENGRIGTNVRESQALWHFPHPGMYPQMLNPQLPPYQYSSAQATSSKTPSRINAGEALRTIDQNIPQVKSSQNMFHPYSKPNAIAPTKAIHKASAEINSNNIVASDKPTMADGSSSISYSGQVDDKKSRWLKLISEKIESPMMKCLCELLSQPASYGNIIAWTGNKCEFKVANTEILAEILATRFPSEKKRSYLQVARALKCFEATLLHGHVVMRKVKSKRNHFELFPDLDSDEEYVSLFFW
ncbi:ets-domain-containing protein [Ditylenchus destructor]|uniref:Ets-domain-containing protein n=1 Tax=Ditylenchus destructor TaxID=166010 RepID=A0AAD4R8X4_9BILA|nr:ets-domain-containing protein [Ditylenchus destructor]